MISRGNISFLVLGVTLAALGGCRSLQLSSPSVAQQAASTATSNYVPFELPDSLSELWSYNAEAGFGSVEPILLGDYVLVANRRGEVHAVNVEDGRKVGAKKFGDAINGSPAIHDGRLYVPVDFGGKKGLKAWNLELGNRVYDVRTPAVESDVLVQDGRILFVDTDSIVRCMDERSGAPIWSVELGDGIPVHASPILIGQNHLVVVDGAGGGVVLDATSGREIKTFHVDGSVYNELAADVDRFYVSTVEGRLYSVGYDDFNTRLLFESSAEFSQLTTAAVSPEVIIVGGSDGLVHAMQRETGTIHWIADVGHPVAAPPFVAGSRVYIGTLGRTLRVLSLASGDALTTYELRGRVKSPLAARDGSLFVLSEPRFLYRFGQGEN